MDGVQSRWAIGCSISSISTSYYPSLKNLLVIIFFLFLFTFFLFPSFVFLFPLSQFRAVYYRWRKGGIYFDSIPIIFPNQPILYPILSPNYASFYIYGSTRNRNGATQSITHSHCCCCCSHTSIHAIEPNEQTTKDPDPFACDLVVLPSNLSRLFVVFRCAIN